MNKVLSIDYGSKRCGLALSDELQMIGSPLKTVTTHELIASLREIILTEGIEELVIGIPTGLRGESTDATGLVRKFIKRIRKTFPDLKIWEEDERFTSKIAFQAMLDGNLGKRKRRDKSVIDKVSASLILQSFLDRRAAENKK